MNIDNQSRPNPPAALRVIRSTIVGNVAGDPARTSINEGVGGGIYNSGGRLMLTNSTVTGNEAIPSFAQGFGSIPGTGRGGGVAHQMLLGDDPNDGTSIVNSTIAYNVAFTGSQLYGSDTVSPMRVANTLVARDATTAGNCASPSAADRHRQLRRQPQLGREPVLLRRSARSGRTSRRASTRCSPTTADRPRRSRCSTAARRSARAGPSRVRRSISAVSHARTRATSAPSSWRPRRAPLLGFAALAGLVALRRARRNREQST